jgi:hypothetical protein
MTALDWAYFIGINGLITLAYFLNHDERKKYLCTIVLTVSIIGAALFAMIDSAERLFWTVGALELIAVGFILKSFKVPQWKNEGYLLMISGLMLFSAWNTIFYTYSHYFTLYADMADTLALTTVAWMIGRSDYVVLLAQGFFGAHGHIFDN